MSTETGPGPIDIIVLGYPAGAAQTGEAVPILADLVERGIIRVLDVLAVVKEADGTVIGAAAADSDGDGFPDLKTLAASSSGMIGDADVQATADALEPGSAAVLIVFENTWAAPFADAVRRNGGQLLAFERIGREQMAAFLSGLRD